MHAMEDLVSVPFEIKGGSPSVLEVQMPDGQRFLLRVATVVINVACSTTMPNPVHPGQPVFNLTAQLLTVAEKIEP